MSLVAELRRRTAIRTGGPHLVGAWLITQAAGAVLRWVNVSESILRALAVVLRVQTIRDPSRE